MEWAPECPASQTFALADGYYRVTLCSDVPASGILGDEQAIDVYFERWEEMPAVAAEGIPTLCE